MDIHNRDTVTFTLNPHEIEYDFGVRKAFTAQFRTCIAGVDGWESGFLTRIRFRSASHSNPIRTYLRRVWAPRRKIRPCSSIFLADSPPPVVGPAKRPYRHVGTKGKPDDDKTTSQDLASVTPWQSLKRTGIHCPSGASNGQTVGIIGILDQFLQRAYESQ